MKNLIKIYDNFFPNDQSANINNFVLRSLYKLGWEDTDEPQHRAYPNLHSSYSPEDVAKIKILEPILKKVKLTKKHYLKCVVNLTKPLDVNFIHMHPGCIVAIYYANMHWDSEWGGETLFYEKDRKTIGLASPYIPNRLIIFDGKVPHTIKSQNLLGPSYRFTIGMFFKKNV